MATATRKKTKRQRVKRTAHPKPSHWRKWCKAQGFDSPVIQGYDADVMAKPGEWFDAEAAQHAIDFIEQCCKHVEGSVAGQPFILEKWQRKLIGCFFGWKRADGWRRFRKLFLYVPRGNGKTPLVAAIVLYLLFADGEAGAQIYLIASRAEQAAVAYRHARGMVMQEPILNRAAQIFKGQSHRAIASKADPMAFIRVFPSDAAGIHGQMPHGVVGDELHAWEGNEARDAIKTAFQKKGRRQPVEAYATTADFDRPSVCNQEYEAACAVRDNGGDPAKPGHASHILPVIYEATEKDDWTAEETWEKANPNIDVTVDRERLREECQEAKERPHLQAEFKRLHLNIRTTSRKIYIPMERWRTCRGYMRLEDLKGRTCGIGLDLSSKQDITAAALVFPPDERFDKYAVRMLFWIPHDGLRERSINDNVPYDVWVKEGFVIPMAGYYSKLVDHDQVRDELIKVASEYRVAKVAYDPWNIGNLPSSLASNGLEVVEFSQGIRNFAHPTKTLDDLTVAGRFEHFGNPVLEWMAQCTETVSDNNGNMRPVKPDRKTSSKRIDGMVALLMGLGVVLAEDTGEAVYERGGMIL